MIRRKHKTNADIFQASGDLVWRQIDLHTQTLQHVSTAALAAHTATTMLANFGASCGHYKHRTGRNVEGVRTIAPSAHNIDHMLCIGHLHFG